MRKVACKGFVDFFGRRYRAVSTCNGAVDFSNTASSREQRLGGIEKNSVKFHVKRCSRESGQSLTTIIRKRRTPLLSRGGELFTSNFKILLWLLYEPEVRLEGLPPVRVFRLCFLIRNGGHNDYVFAVLPVRRRCDLVIGRQLDRVDDAEYF